MAGFEMLTDKEGNRPSLVLPAAGWTRVTRFLVTNYDEDHISDLPNLRATLPIDDSRLRPRFQLDSAARRNPNRRK